MTPEKRPADEEESLQDAKKLKESAADTKDRLPIPSESGTVVWMGCAQWEYIGRRNLKLMENLIHYMPRRLSAFSNIRISFVASHCTAAHTIFISDEGKAFALGRNEKGQLGIGDTEVRSGVVPMETMSEFTVVSAAVGRSHTLLLTDKGCVFACGDNKSGQCGTGSTTPTITAPVRIDFKEGKIKKVACGGEFSMMVDSKGYLYSFGLPEYGQLGHNTDGKYFITSNKLAFHHEKSPRRVPVFVERSKDGNPTPIVNVCIEDVVCGANHTVARDSNKRTFSWGFGGYGRLGHAENKDEMVPRLIKFFDGNNRQTSEIYAGATFSIGVSPMGIFLWGQTKRTGEANMYPKPIQDLCGWNINSVGCSNTSIVVSADDSVICWGPSPTYGELGLGENIRSTTTPKENKYLEGSRVVQVTCGQGHTVMIVKDDQEEDKKILDKLKEISL